MMFLGRWYVGLLIAGLTTSWACRPAAPAPGSAEPLFNVLPPAATGVDFANRLRETEEFNIIEYLYYYNGGGVAAGDLDGDGLPELFFTGNQVSNRLYHNRGDRQFTDITASAGIATAGVWSTGVTMADVNGDGRLDIYVCQLGDYKNQKGRNQLFINEGELQFREAAAEYGLDFQGFSTQAAFFDYDLDGDLDCYLLNHSVHSTENYAPSDIRSEPDPKAGDRLYRNEGDRFTDVTEEAGIYSSRIGFGLGVATGDLNSDGYPDIYVSNDFHDNDYLYLNKGDGSFSEQAAESLGHTSTFSMGSDLADFNNDGRPDLLSLDMKPADESILKRSVGADPYNIYQFKLRFGYHYQYPRNMLQLNRGELPGAGLQFSEVGQLAGVAATDWSWSPLLCDFDGDGRKDLFISNGIWRRPNDLDYLKYLSNQQVQESATDLEMASHMPQGQVANFAFRNEGNLTFADSSAAWGLDQIGCSNGAAYADLDGDGDPDLVLNNLNAPATLYENRAADRKKARFLTVRLRGTDRNPFGIGARVTLAGDGEPQVQELYTTRGFQSATPPELYFGRPSGAAPARLTVRWPDGRRQTLDEVAWDTVLVLRQKEAVRETADTSEAVSPYFAEVGAELGIDFVHRENEFIDFDYEKLLPHQLSTQGPALAVADVDGDGREDFFVGGARGQAGALYRQLPGGRFERIAVPAFEEDRIREQVDAAFFDADGDGDPDLYVVSGGGETSGEVERLRDRLYRNDGNGRFSVAEDALPEWYANGACVAPGDFDNDGDTDLFVGGRSSPGSYGLNPRSYLLENDGKGRFLDATLTLAPALAEPGMVTDAVWIAAEGRLIVVGEWMPVTAFYPGRDWMAAPLPGSNGWWNTVEAADLDGDGDTDLVLGNLGLNAELKASPEEPVELYVRDFDNNRTIDPVLTYYKQGRPYTYHSRDELFKQLVGINKKFNEYEAFAESEFHEVFSREELREAEHKKAVTFASALAVNDGLGRYELQPLPRMAQVAPLFAFLPWDEGGAAILAAGNFYDVAPNLGRYDAGFGHLLIRNDTGAWQTVAPTRSGFVVNGQGRRLAAIETGSGEKLVIVARNNDRLLVFRPSRAIGELQ